MGISMPYLMALDRAGAIPRNGSAILDIGASNIYGATTDELIYFLEKYGKAPVDARLRAKAADLSERSDPTHPRALTFVHELLEETTIEYQAIDVFPGPRTRIFDLNFESLPRSMVGRFDLVLNFGTTEHVFGQFNAFKVIHDALKPGGHAFHQLPSTGFFNHGYFKYHPKLFGELAAANGYEIVDLYYSEPQGHATVAAACTPPPNLTNPTHFRTTVAALGAEAPTQPNGLINALLRKGKAGRFRAPLETLSTLGPVAPAGLVSPVRLARRVLKGLGVGRALRAMGLR
jgi:SAM-dependent methyltransferase